MNPARVGRSPNHVAQVLAPTEGHYWVRATQTEFRDERPWCIAILKTRAWDSTGREYECREWWGEAQPGFKLQGDDDRWLVGYEIAGPIPEPEG